MLEGSIEYVLYSDTDQPLGFHINLDHNSVTYVVPHPDFAPGWAKLENNQCSHCPLSAETNPLCPLAERLIPFVKRLSSLSSIEKVQVTIRQFERETVITAPAQDILGSLLGLFIATSDCPHTLFLRPMAHTHLPMADIEETIYRALAMYRLAQYYRKKNTGKEDLNFKGLESLYAQLKEVNIKMSLRMKQALKDIHKEKKSDGTMNALSLLDALAEYVGLSIESGVNDLEPMFATYWKDHKK